MAVVGAAAAEAVPAALIGRSRLLCSGVRLAPRRRTEGAMSRARKMRARVFLVTGIVLAMIVSGLLVVGSSAGAGSRMCLGRTATIVGTSGNDVIYGTNGSDVIVGGRGVDQVHGLGGDDFICGEGGRDILTGGSGDDQLLGGGAGDGIFGGSGDDFLSGGDQADQLHGGSGDDDMQGDTLLSSPNDTCDGGDGIDTARSDCDSVSNVP
jgi:Ca2+-binding RTX toxin-like protein